MVDVRIGQTRSRTRITPEGEFEEYYEVEFFVGDARHKAEISPVGFTAKKAEELVKARAAELIALQGKKVQI